MAEKRSRSKPKPKPKPKAAADAPPTVTSTESREAARTRPNDDTETPPWWADGLRFGCTRCGNCCRGPDPGWVWMDEGEIERLAAFLELDLDAFGSKYLRRVGERLSLVEQPITNDCVFWDEMDGCTVYEARPAQCRTFPFWPENVASPSDWEQVGASCPGQGIGPKHDRAAIEKALAETPPDYQPEFEV